jgi:hypothetical protein
MRWGGRRVAAALAAAVLVAAGCGGGDDDDTADATTTSRATGDGGPSGGGPAEPVEVDRTSRFSQLGTFCEPADEAPEEAPEATDVGITEESVSITHVRVTLEDLEGIGFAIPIGDPRDQAERFVGIVNERCGGIHGRQLDLSLVEWPPLAPPGEDPAALAQAACIEATEDDDAVIAFSGSGFGGQGGAECIAVAHDTIFLTTYNIPEEVIEQSEGRAFSLAFSSVQGLRYLARTLHERGDLEGATIGIVMPDAPGDPDIVERGLIDTLEELGYEIARVDTIGCGGGNSCTTGINESVSGMIADGVDVLFPLLNVISLPSYVNELATQGVQPGQIQMYQSGYNAQSGDLVSSKVVEFGDAAAGELYDGTVIVDSGRTGAFREPGFEPVEFAEMCNREYQDAGGEAYEADDPETNSAYGATTGMCTFIRLIARAVEAAGPNPTRADIAAALEELGGIDTGSSFGGSFGPGKHTAPVVLNLMRFHYPCPEDKVPFGPGTCIIPEGEPFAIPADD